MGRKRKIAGALLILAVIRKRRRTRQESLKRRRRTIWVKPWLANRDAKSAYNNILQELRLQDQEEFRKYLRMNTESYQVIAFIY